MIVTISREFGAGALQVARIVADRCGLRLITDELPQIVAGRLGIAQADGMHDEDAVPSLLARLAVQLPGATLDLNASPLVDESDAYDADRRRIEHSIKDAAESIEAVILGRAASQVLGARWNVIRVFLHAPRTWRIERLTTLFGYTADDAVDIIQRIDAARKRYLREYYGVIWGDARAYDMTFDMSRLPIGDVAEAIISAVAARYNPS